MINMQSYMHIFLTTIYLLLVARFSQFIFEGSGAYSIYTLWSNNLNVLSFLYFVILQQFIEVSKFARHLVFPF